MYNEGGSPTVTNCTFRENFASSGGGICNNSSSSPMVTNCIFSGNLAGGGGGVFNSNSSSPTLTNCTFSENRAWPYGGGMYNYSSSPTVTNCIFWGDLGEVNVEIYDDGGSSTTVTYSDVKGGYPGTGNINANPVIINAGRRRPASGWLFTVCGRGQQRGGRCEHGPGR